MKQKFGLLYTISHRNSTIVSDSWKFRIQVKTLNKKTHKNAYPTKFV